MGRFDRAKTIEIVTRFQLPVTRCQEAGVPGGRGVPGAGCRGAGNQGAGKYREAGEPGTRVPGNTGRPGSRENGGRGWGTTCLGVRKMMEIRSVIFFSPLSISIDSLAQRVIVVSE